MLIDASYFIGDLNIPNTDEDSVNESVNWFIQKHEPLFLKKLMGYSLYKDFIAGLNVVPPATPDIKWLDILYGKEFTDFAGRLQRWRGIIETDLPIFNLVGGYVFRKPEYIRVGTTPLWIAGATSVVITDWIGWTPIINRNTNFMDPGVDYSWDPGTGTFELLVPGDKLGDKEFLFVSFDLRTDTVSPSGPNKSCIANYVYYWYQRNEITKTMGIAEVQPNAENAINISPNQKMARAWNELNEWAYEFIQFMDVRNNTTPQVYPQWLYQNRYDALREFEFVNPIF